MLNTEPPSIIRQAERPRHQAIREQAIALAVRAATDSLELGWVLGEIRANEDYKRWPDNSGTPYLSFLSWVNAEIACYVSKSMAYELSTVGIFMKSARPQVEQMVADKKVGITRLMRLASLIERNKISLTDAIGAVEDGHALDEERKGEPDPEQFVKMPIAIPRGDAPHVQRGLLYHAIRNGHPTIDRAVMDLAISEAQDTTLPPWAEKYLDLIEAGKFFCELCGRIPLVPNLHHVIPRSIGGGDGPVVLLDQNPCHLDIVQKNWKKYGAKFLGKKNFEALLQKYKTAGVDLPDEAE